MSRKNSGRIVETKTGKLGYIYNRDEWVNGKVVVYVSELDVQPELFGDDAVKLKNAKTVKTLCDPKTLKLIGFFD